MLNKTYVEVYRQPRWLFKKKTREQDKKFYWFVRTPENKCNLGGFDTLKQAIAFITEKGYVLKPD